MVIAAGSYPAGRWFESDRRYQKRLLGQAVKTSPFHGGNTGSIPVGVTIWGVSSVGRASALQAEGHRFEPCTPHQTNLVQTNEIFLFSADTMQTPTQATQSSKFFCVNAGQNSKKKAQK